MAENSKSVRQRQPQMQFAALSCSVANMPRMRKNDLCFLLLILTFIASASVSQTLHKLRSSGSSSDVPRNISNTVNTNTVDRISEFPAAAVDCFLAVSNMDLENTALRRWPLEKRRGKLEQLSDPFARRHVSYRSFRFLRR